MTAQAADGAEPLRIRVLARLIRPLVGLALREFLKRQSRPSWQDRAIVSGPAPLRVLIIGAGLAVGYGGDDEDDALPRQVAAALARATGRGVVVETRAQASVTLEQTLTLLGVSGAARFDHLIWSPTLEEVARGSSRRWSRQLHRIIESARSSGPAHLRIVLMGVVLVEGDHVLQRAGRVLGATVNRRIEAVAEASAGTGFLAVPSRVVPSLDSPLFDAAYRQRVTAMLVEHLRQAEAPAARPSAAPTA